MRIAELYRSIQGEGRLTGVDSVFVRTSGCNLRCWFCDTPFTSWLPEGEDWSVDDIVARVTDLATSHVVITGGEPMLFAELVPLCDRLHTVGYHITIETAGTLHLPVHCDLMSISPKMAGSAPSEFEHPRWHARHERTRHQPQIVRRLLDEYDYQLKFVIDTPADVDEVERYLMEFTSVDRGQVMLMPQGTNIESLNDRAHWLEPLCDARGFQYCRRRHIEWFGFQRGT